MSRTNFETPMALEELISAYYENKNELDSYKKICDSQNSQIKQRMSDMELDTFEFGSYKAKITVSNRETTNEDKLLAVMKRYGITDAIKTKEYVDMDALENYLYHNVTSAELANDIDACIERKEVKSLKVTYKKEK